VATRNARSFSSSSSDSPSSLKVLRNKLLRKPSLIDKTNAYTSGNITKVSPTPSADEIVLYTNTELNRNGRSFESTCAKKSNENPLLKFVILLLLRVVLRSRVVLHRPQNHKIIEKSKSSKGGVWLFEDLSRFLSSFTTSLLLVFCTTRDDVDFVKKDEVDEKE
jgi:hypothetical protein